MALAAAAVVVTVGGILVAGDRPVEPRPGATRAPAATPTATAVPTGAPPVGVDTTGAVPWSERTDYEEWVAPEPPGPMGYVDPPARWVGLSATLTMPATVTPGASLDYVVTLRNGGAAPVDLRPCPGFRQQLDNDDLDPEPLVSATWRLHCDGLDPIPVGGEQRFVMHVEVPATVSGSELFVRWELVDGWDQGAQAWVRIDRGVSRSRPGSRHVEPAQAPSPAWGTGQPGVKVPIRARSKPSG